MVIKEADLINYLSCPIKYISYKNNNIKQNDTFNSILHDMYKWIINTYCYEGIDELGNSIKKKWDKTCLLNQDIISSKQVLKGWFYLDRVFNDLYYNKPHILDVNIPYHIEIEGTGHALEGQIDMMCEYNKDSVEILIPGFSNKMPESYVFDNNIKYIMDAYAIKYLYNMNTYITYHNYNLDKYKYTIKDNKDINRLKLIIKNVCTCIENDLLYPHNGYHCSGCLARTICSEWGKYEEI